MSLAQMEVMLYLLLDKPPNRFLAESKPEYTLEINKHQNIDQIELFLKEVVYPPIQYKRIVNEKCMKSCRERNNSNSSYKYDGSMEGSG